MIAISFIMQMGQHFIWMTISPADNNNTAVLQLCGVDIDVTIKLKSDFPDFAERLRLVAFDPVASVDFDHTTIDGVLRCLLRFGASDGDGGVLGRIKGYVGMTEEQKNLVLHCRVLIWIYGFNDFASFRDFMHKTPERYTELTRFLKNIIFNQIATLDDINRVMNGSTDMESSTGVTDENLSSPDPLVRHAKERVAAPPPPDCSSRDGCARCRVHDNAYARLLYLDLAELTPGANLHRCQATCHKYSCRDSCRSATLVGESFHSCNVSCFPTSKCVYVSQKVQIFFCCRRIFTQQFSLLSFFHRFGYGDEGKPIVAETVVQRRRCVFDTNCNMTIDGVVHSPDSTDDTAAAAGSSAFKVAFEAAITNLVGDYGRPDPVSDRFNAQFRRQHTHINSLNPIIQFGIRSNMDIKVLLRDSDAKGLLYFILHHPTKTEQTLDVLLPLLIPVVERMREESNGATDKGLAVLPRAFLSRKQVSSLNIGGPAAASKALDLADHKISHNKYRCMFNVTLAGLR